MPPESPRPVLSIAIPTYNRSVYLAELLECLLPQLHPGAPVELLISDNASPDDTEAVVRAFLPRFAAAGIDTRYVRNQQNLGADGNFLQCLDLPSGKYIWVMGDDDLLAPGTIPRLLALLAREEFDLIYLSSLGFSGDERPQVGLDPLGRFAERMTDGRVFMDRVNAMITLVSANIVNRDRLRAVPHPPLSDLVDSKLLQLGWLFPLIQRRCRVLYVWERVLFHRSFNSGGWGICDIFGIQLNSIATRYFAADPQIARNLMNYVLAMWLPDHILQMRRGDLRTMEAEQFSSKLAPLFRGNWRFWVFVVPAASWPLPLAKIVHRFNRTVMKLIRSVHMVVHYLLHRGDLLNP